VGRNPSAEPYPVPEKTGPSLRVGLKRKGGQASFHTWDMGRGVGKKWFQ